MNDEIKEILNKISNVVNHKEASYNALVETKAGDYKLLDYITNLQQDLANYVNVILHDRNVIDDYKSRVEKAVEKLKREYYINEHEWNDRTINEVLNILQNGDDEK